jgi:stage V sporulation protein B
MVSERNAQGDTEGSFQVLRKAMLLMIILGGGFSLAMIICAKQLVLFFKWDHKSMYSLIAISIAPVFISVMSVYRGFFQGLQDMTPTAISQVLEQMGRIVVGILLVYALLPKGIEYSAAGAAFGACAGGIIALIYLFILYNKYKSGMYIKNVKRKDTMDILIRTAIPISLGASVGSIMNLIDSALVPMKLYQAGFS